MIQKWRKEKQVLLSAMFFFALTMIDSAHLLAAESAGPAIEISAGGQGSYLNRSRGFKIGNTGQWGHMVLNASPGQENALPFDLDHWAGSYKIDATLHRNAWSYETGFRQTFAHAHDVKTGLPGTGAGLLTNIAFIDGQPHGTAQTFGYFLSAGPVAGQSRPGSVSLDYRSMNFEIPFYAVHPLWERGRFVSQFFAGPVYSRFSQRFLVHTSGTNSTTGGETSSKITEKMTENLFGARMGLRGNLRLPSNIFFNLEQSSGFFVSRGRLTAAQEITRGSGNSGGGATYGNLNETITTRDTEISPVAHFLTLVETGCHIGERMTLIFFAQFEEWFNLSRIENPIVSANLRSILNGPAQLKSDENLHVLSLGGEVVVEL